MRSQVIAATPWCCRPLAIVPGICQKTKLNKQNEEWRCTMALVDGMLNGWGSTALAGVGVVIAAPLLLSVVGAVVRSVAKELIKGSLWVVDSLQEMAAEGGGQLSDLVAEARAEYDTNGVTTTVLLEKTQS